MSGDGDFSWEEVPAHSRRVSSFRLLAVGSQGELKMFEVEAEHSSDVSLLCVSKYPADRMLDPTKEQKQGVCEFQSLQVLSFAGGQCCVLVNSDWLLRLQWLHEEEEPSTLLFCRVQLTDRDPAVHHCVCAETLFLLSSTGLISVFNTTDGVLMATIDLPAYLTFDLSGGETSSFSRVQVSADLSTAVAVTGSYVAAAVDLNHYFRPGVWERRERPPPEDSEEEDGTTASVDVLKDHEYAATPDPAVVDLVVEENNHLREEIRQLREQVESLTLRQRFSIHRFATSDNDIRFYTRIYPNHLLRTVQQSQALLQPRHPKDQDSLSSSSCSLEAFGAPADGSWEARLASMYSRAQQSAASSSSHPAGTFWSSSPLCLQSQLDPSPVHSRAPPGGIVNVLSISKPSIPFLLSVSEFSVLLTFVTPGNRQTTVALWDLESRKVSYHRAEGEAAPVQLCGERQHRLLLKSKFNIAGLKNRQLDMVDFYLKSKENVLDVSRAADQPAESELSLTEGVKDLCPALDLLCSAVRDTNSEAQSRQFSEQLLHITMSFIHSQIRLLLCSSHYNQPDILSCVVILERYITELRSYMKRFPWSSTGAAPQGGVEAEEWHKLPSKEVVCHFILTNQIPRAQAVLRRSSQAEQRLPALRMEGLRQVFFCLQHKDLQTAKTLLINMGLSVKEQLHSICTYSNHTNLREFLVSHFTTETSKTQREVQITSCMDELQKLGTLAGVFCGSNLFRFPHLNHEEGGEEVLKELLDHRIPEEKEELWRNLRLDWVRNWDLSCQTSVFLSRLNHTEVSCCDSAVLWRYLTALHDQQRAVDWIQTQRTATSSCWPEITPELVNNHMACSTLMKENILDLLARRGMLILDEMSDLEQLFWRLAQGRGLMTSPPPLPQYCSSQGLDFHSVVILFCLEHNLQYLLYTYLEHYRLTPRYCSPLTDQNLFKTQPWFEMLVKVQEITRNLSDPELVFQAILTSAQVLLPGSQASLSSLLLEGHSLLALAAIMFAPGGIDQVIAQGQRSDCLGRIVDPQLLKMAMAPYPKLRAALFPTGSCGNGLSFGISIYHLLQSLRPLDPSRLFGWQTANTLNLNGVSDHAPIVYSRDQLLSICSSAVPPPAEQPDVPRELRRKRHGRCAGIGCRSQGRREPAVMSTVKQWTEETEEALRDCFSSTVWEELCAPHGEDIDSITDCITDYVNFYVDNTVPIRTEFTPLSSQPLASPFIPGNLISQYPSPTSILSLSTLQVRNELRKIKFAYRPGIGVDDAIVYLRHQALTHLEKPGSTVRIMFFDFSSAFNTIQPGLLRDKLELSGVDHHMSQSSYEAAQDWILPVQFCQLHNLKLSPVYPSHCADHRQVVHFLVFVQLHNFPLQQVQSLVSRFGPSLEAHLNLVFQDLQVHRQVQSGCLRTEETSGRQNHPTDMFQVLLQSQEELVPCRYLLHKALDQRCPVLAILASCLQKPEWLSCLCVWLLTSVDAVTAEIASAHLAEAPQHHEWTLQDLSIIWRTLLGRGHVIPLLHGFKLFQRDCPLVLMLRMFELCCDYRNFTEAKTKLLDFQKTLITLRNGGPVPSDSLPVQWVESQASVLLLTMLQRCSSQYDLHRLLQLLADVDNILKSTGPDFRKLSQLSQLLQGLEVKLPSRLLQCTSSSVQQEELQLIVDALQTRGLYSHAREVALLAGLPVHQLLLNQVSQEVNSQRRKQQWRHLEKRVSFWKKCHKQLEADGIDPHLASQFFLSQSECGTTDPPAGAEAQTKLLDILERSLLLQLTAHWLSQLSPFPLDELEKLEKNLWLNRIHKDLLTAAMEQESMFNLPPAVSPETNAYQEVLRDFSFSNITELNTDRFLSLEGLPDPSEEQQIESELSVEERRVLTALVDQLLDEGRIHEASRVCWYFSMTHPDVWVVLHCHSLACGHLRPEPQEEPSEIMEGQNMPSSFSHSSLSSFVMQLPEDTTSVQLQRLKARCHHGNNYCKQVLSLYQLSQELQCTFYQICTENPGCVLKKLLLLEQPDCYRKAQTFIRAQGLSAEIVADLLSSAVVQALLASTQELQPGEKQVFKPSEGRDSLVQLIKLCKDPSLVGLRLLETLPTVPLRDLNCIVELLIVAHSCFSLTCNMEGIVRVLQAARHLSHTYLAPGEHHSLLVRLLTGIGRYNEMTYIFDLLHQNHCFEMLLRKKVDTERGQSSSLKMALLDYIKRCLPADSEKHNMVALCFSMRREIGENHEIAARTQLKMIESRVWVVTPDLKNSLTKVLALLKDAAESFSKDSCVRQATHCVQTAKLVALQLHFLNQGSDLRIINLQPAEIPGAVMVLPRCYQVFVMSEAYSYSPDWPEILHQNVVLKGDFVYLEELKRHRPLTSTLFEDIFRKLDGSPSTVTSNVKRLLTYCDDAYTCYRLAYQQNLFDVTKTLLQDNKTSNYLNDRLAC
ncbi:spatacsin [Nematolebias whitei]|uniref:spatacsin n=1 Tax=Nematolebias whitei TaxID=451745 RepID=UPI001896CBE3|nr:spatacsin [Nematolebias whitei]